MNILDFLLGKIYRLSFFEVILFVLLLHLSYSVLRDFCKNKSEKLWRILKICFWLLSIALVLYVTVFTREKNEIWQIVFTPFNFLREAVSQPELYRTFFMNVLLFLPIGITMPYVLTKNHHKINVIFTVVFAFVLSCLIEFLQYRYHLGRAETDDVIANVLGAGIGCLSYGLYLRAVKNEKGMGMNFEINENQSVFLNVCSNSLFDQKNLIPDDLDTVNILAEAKQQAVYPLVYSVVRDKAEKSDGEFFSHIITNNIRVEYAHGEINSAFKKFNVKYVVLKGVSSATYYREPLLRTMGDVDVLISESDILSADKALKSIGFVTNEKLDTEKMHVAYKRSDGIICELHFRVNGLPDNGKTIAINNCMSDIFKKSFEHKTENYTCVLPSKFHHGLILLLHTASHLTSEGVGIRHLCDWAVFVNSFSNDEFVGIFEKSLKETGLWRFAQLLTLTSVKYLGCEPKHWAGECDENLLEGIVADILNGGNFGTKDADRYRQIKYIGDREKRTVNEKSPVFQLFSTINSKTKTELKFTQKYKFLLPLGYVITVLKYFWLLVCGERKFDTVSTLTAAETRKKIYTEFRLFEDGE